MSSGSGRVAPPNATRPDTGVLPIPELLAIVAATVLLWYLLGRVIAGALVATMALFSAFLSLLIERDEEPSGTRRLALVVRRLRWPLILLVVGLAAFGWFRVQQLSGLPEFRAYVVLYVFACPVGGLVLVWWLLAAGKRETTPVKESREADQAGKASALPFHRGIAAVGGLLLGMFWAISLLGLSWFVRLGLLTSQPRIERPLPPGAPVFARSSVAALGGLLHQVQQAPLGHFLPARIWPLLVAGAGLLGGFLIGFAVIGAIRPVLMVSSEALPHDAEPAVPDRRALRLPTELRSIRVGLLGIAVVVALVASDRTRLALHGYEGGGRPVGKAGGLGSVDWASTIRDVDCSITGHGLEVNAEQYGDVTGDGKAEAFVAVACVPVTSSWPEQFKVFDGASDPSNPRQLATLLGYDDGTDERGLRIASIAITGRTVVVKSRGYHPDDPNAAGPRYHVQDSFTWDGSHFVRGSRKVS